MKKLFILLAIIFSALCQAQIDNPPSLRRSLILGGVAATETLGYHAAHILISNGAENVLNIQSVSSATGTNAIPRYMINP